MRLFLAAVLCALAVPTIGHGSIERAPRGAYKNALGELSRGGVSGRAKTKAFLPDNAWELNMTFFLRLAFFAGGYAASIYTWPKLKEWANGAEAEIERLKTRIDNLKGRL